jgi:threonyl-tRNA synthetase
LSEKKNITLPDSSQISVEKGATVFDAIGTIGAGLQNAALSAVVNGEPVDLTYNIDEDIQLNVVTFNSDGGQEVFWHSASHLLAQAVKRLYKDAIFAIGPAVDNGFYYDIDMGKTLSLDDLEKMFRRK